MSRNDRLADLTTRIGKETGVRHLAECLALADRMHFSVLSCDMPIQADAALAVLGKAVSALRGEAVRFRRFPLVDDSPVSGLDYDRLAADVLNALFDRQSAEGEEVFVIDASRAGKQEEDAWMALFQRLNEMRNVLMERLPGPLLLVAPPLLEIEFCYRAPDFWSIRSTYAKVASAPGLEFGGAEPVYDRDRTEAVADRPDVERLLARISEARRRRVERPDDVDAARSLVILLGRLGDYEMNWGQLAQAEADHLESLKIMKELIALDPNRAEWRRGLSSSLNKVGDVHRTRGDLGKALAAYEESIDVIRDLQHGLSVRTKPSTALKQGGLSD